MLFVHSLTNEELEELNEFLRTTSQTRYYRRGLIIKLSNNGKKVPEIAELLDYDPLTVRSWIHRYDREGLVGLKDKLRSGRPPEVTEDYVKLLLDEVRKSPKILGYNRTRWSTESLAEHLEKLTGISISGEWVRMILHKHGISFHRPKLRISSPDPMYEIKKKNRYIVKRYTK